MPMKTYRLQKAVILPDGSSGGWMVSTFGGKPELWFSLDAAFAAAESRSEMEVDGCFWRVEDHGER